MHSHLISILLFAAAAIAAPLDAANQFSGPAVAASDNVEAGGPCKPITMIYARGTWEPGSPPSQVAAPLIKALEVKYPGKVEALIVEYDGGASGYLTGGSVDGTQKMEKMTKEAASRCPDSKILLVGYR
jgi:cutinase